MNYAKKDVTEMLQHSNWIEEEYSDVALEDAEKAWAYLSKLKRVTAKEVLHVHKLLAKRIRPDIAGKFRCCDVWIGGKHKKFIDDSTLLFQVNNVLSAIHSCLGAFGTQKELEKMAMGCHILFEEAHPFLDFNGRCGRLILNWQRKVMGLPILIIHEGEEQYAYYKLFKGKRAAELKYFGEFTKII